MDYVFYALYGTNLAVEGGSKQSMLSDKYTILCGLMQTRSIAIFKSMVAFHSRIDY